MEEIHLTIHDHTSSLAPRVLALEDPMFEITVEQADCTVDMKPHHSKTAVLDLVIAPAALGDAG